MARAHRRRHLARRPLQEHALPPLSSVAFRPSAHFDSMDLRSVAASRGRMPPCCGNFPEPSAREEREEQQSKSLQHLAEAAQSRLENQGRPSPTFVEEQS